jgi:hypothetical protein
MRSYSLPFAAGLAGEGAFAAAFSGLGALPAFSVSSALSAFSFCLPLVSADSFSSAPGFSILPA